MGKLSKFFKKLKRVIGVVAMIAAPFIAAPIAAAIGVSGAIGTAITGAVVGGVGASAAGVNPAIGAAIGGIGGFMAGGGGAGLFGGAKAVPGMAGGGGTATGMAGGAVGGATAGVAPVATAGLSTAAAPSALGKFFGGLNVGNLAPLAMAMFGKAPEDLTPIEEEAVVANAQTSAVEKGVFDEQLAGARSLLQQGEANPERAYGQAQMATQRGLRDIERTAGISERPGMRESERRRAAIEGARIGTAAVTGEQARAAEATRAGLSSLPTEVPTSGAELNMKIYEDLYKRRSDYAQDLAGGAGQLYDSYTSNRNKLV
jgi:hypothetical protein